MHTFASHEAQANAERLLERIADAGLPQPELCHDPDGMVSMDWVFAKDRVLSLSVGVSAKMAYAWIANGERGSGLVTIRGPKAMQWLAQTIERVKV